jgi:hypothetical protein
MLLQNILVKINNTFIIASYNKIRYFFIYSNIFIISDDCEDFLVQFKTFRNFLAVATFSEYRRVVIVVFDLNG